MSLRHRTASCLSEMQYLSPTRDRMWKRLTPAHLEIMARLGYQLLTSFLPNNGGSPGLGNRTYNLHAIVHNTAGVAVDLGTRTDSAHAAKPFGTIDTPGRAALYPEVRS